jgi:hypothetical protein
MAFPNTVIARPICQSLRHRKSWLNSGSSGCQPLGSSWCSTPLTTDSNHSRVLICGGLPIFGNNRTCTVLLEQPRPIVTPPILYVTARSQHNRSLQLLQTTELAIKAQSSDKSRFCSLFQSEYHEASTPIKPRRPLIFLPRGRLHATANVSCNAGCERTPAPRTGPFPFIQPLVRPPSPRFTKCWFVGCWSSS